MRRDSYRPARDRGFTLTELLVVIALIVILAAAAVPMMATVTEQSTVETARDVIGDVVRQARTEAISLNTVVSVEIVNVQDTDTTYQATKLILLESGPGVIGQSYAARRIEGKIVTLPKGVTISGPADGWSGRSADSIDWSDADGPAGGTVTPPAARDLAAGPDGTLRDTAGELTITLDNNQSGGAHRTLMFKISRITGEVIKD